MSYDSFKNSKKKIEKLWNKVTDIKNSLGFSENQYKKLYNEKQNLKAPLVIFDSDWVVKTLSNFAASTTTEGYKLPYTPDDTFDYLSPIDFYCPADYLPFLKLNVQYKQIPDVDIVSFASYKNSQWSGNKVEVKGDNDLIFYGTQPVGNPPQFTQAQLDAGAFQSNHAKKIYTYTIIWTDVGGQWRLRPSTASLNNSHVSNAYMIYDRISSGLTRLFDSTTIYNYKELTMVRDSFATSLNTVLTLDATTISLRGSYTSHTWSNENKISTTNYGGTIQLVSFDIISVNSVTVNGSPAGYTVTGNKQISMDSPLGGGESLVIDYQGAEDTQSSSSNTDATSLWSNVYSYTLTLTESILDKWNGSSYIQQGGISTRTFDTTVTSFALISQTFSNGQRYSVYYDTDTRFIFGMDALGALISPPSSQDTYPVSFTAITVKRNTGGAAPISSESDQVVTLTDDSNLTFLLLEENSTGINKYRIFPDFHVVYMIPALKSTNQNFTIWDDIYTLVGTAFVETTHDHSGILTVANYNADTPDVELKVQLYINNPLIYSKQTRAINEQL